MKKKILSLFLVLTLCLSLLPTAAFAESTGEAAQETRRDPAVGDVYTVGEDTVVQNEEVRNAAVQAAHVDHPICGAAHTDTGDHTGECPAVTWTAWDGTSDIVYDSSNTAYVYLSGNAEREKTLEIRDGYTLYLCLNGYSLTKTTEDSNPSFEGVITIYQGAQFTLCDCRGGGKITHAEGMLGRGVRCGDSSSGSRATFAMFGGEISGNHAGTSDAGQDGAGVEVHNATFNMYGGRIINNEVAVPLNNDGGGVCAHTGGSFTMYGGEISGNTSARDGGGVSVVAASFTMKGGSITNNTASAGNGGGAALYNGRFELSGGTITGNSATRNGGGVYYYHYQSIPLTVSGSVTINGNKNAAGADNNVYLSSGVYMIVTGELKNVIGVTTESVPSASNAVMIAANGGNMTEAMKDHFVYDLAGDCKSVYDSTNRAIYLKVIPHEHPICGAAHTDIGDHTGECPAVTWTAWNGEDAIPYDSATKAAYVYLSGNAEREETLEIRDGYTLYLCLNGHSITTNKSSSVVTVGNDATFSLCDCKDGGKLTHGMYTSSSRYSGHGVHLTGSKGTFNMYGGNITGNRASYGGGVTIDKEYSNATFNLYGGSITDNATTGGDGGGGVHALFGTFTMYGGSITGNNAENATFGGGGVYAGSRTGKFYMKGGSITGNTAKNGGGVYVYKSSEFYVSGSVDITGNKNTLGIDENVYLRSGAYFVVNADLNADAKIGVTSADTIAAGDHVTIAKGANKGYTEGNITSDQGSDYTIKREGDDVNLYYGLHEHCICGGDTCTGVGHTCGEKVTFKAWSGASGELPTESGYYYLTDNMTLTTKWQPPEGSNIVLCLNGKTITAKVGTQDSASMTHNSIDLRTGVTVSVTDCVGTGKISRSTYDQRAVNVWGGTFNLYGGKITEFKADATSGGGVAITNCGIFNMYGGAVTNNTSSYGGGGVYVGYFNNSVGTFNMHGGSITGNTSYTDGAGVCVSSNSSMTISGKVKITNNTKSSKGINTVNNVYLPRNKTITVTGELTGGANSIGVTTSNSLKDGSFIAVANGTDSYTLTDNEKDAFSEDEGSRFNSKLLRGNTLLLTRFVDIPMHEHALCGAACSHTTAHSDELWQPLTYYSSTQELYCGPAEASRSQRSGLTADNKEAKYYLYTIPSGNYYLATDITLGGDGGSITGGVLEISGDVKLCLNGKTLSTTLIAYNINVIKVNMDSSLTLCDCSTDGSGKITSENKVYTCVQPVGAQNTGKKSGKFTMYGGTLTGAYYGVALNDADSVALYGGTITGNDMGVSVNYPVTIGGTVNITGNARANVWLLNKSTTGLIEIDPSLTQDSRIGVRSEQTPSETSPSVKIATGAAGTLDYTEIFTPDVTDQGYVITKDGAGNLYLTKHTHNWTYTANDGTATITATCSNNDDGNCPLGGDGGSVTLKAPTGTLTYTGMDQPATYEGTLSTGETPAITYSRQGSNGPEALETGALPKGANTYIATLTVGDKSVSVDYTVKKAKLTIKANDNTIVYGDTASDKGVTYSGFVNGEDESVLGGELTYIFSYTPGMDKGLYIITPEGKTSGNYDITFTLGTLTVTQREVTLTWDGYENRTYGDGKTVTATAGNLVNNDDVKVTVENGDQQTSGTYTATATGLTGSKAGNYKLPTTGLTQEYTIGAAAQTLTFASSGDQSVTYGDTLANPATNNRADGSEVTYSSSDPAVATVDANGKVTVKKVGTATITATAEAIDGKYSKATESYKLTVSPKELTVNDLELTGSLTKVYDGTDSAANVGAQVKSGVLVGNDTLTITGSARYNSKDVKDANTITFTPDAITMGNYRLAADQTPIVTDGVKITKRVLTVGNVTTAPKTFDGYDNATFYVTNVALNNFANGETLAFYTTETGGDYGIYDTKFDSANAGARTITGTVALLSTPAAANYTFEDAGGNESTTATFTADGEIVKANARDLGTVQLKQRYTDTDEKEYQPDYAALMPANAGKLTYDVSCEVTKGTANVGKNDKEEATGKLTYQISAQAGAEITWTFTVRSDNYKDSTFKLVVTITDRDKQENFKFKNTTITKTYGDPDFTVAATGAEEGSAVTYTSSDPAVATVDADGTVTIKKAGTVTITATAEQTDVYASASASYTLTVNKLRIPVPTAGTNELVYNGKMQTYMPDGLDTTYCKIERNTAKDVIDGNNWNTADVTLEDTANTEWDEGENNTTPRVYQFRITPKPITVTALDKKITAGQPAPDLIHAALGTDYTIDGLIGSDSLSVSLYYADPSDIDTAVTPDTSRAGTYAIVAAGGGTGNPNYAPMFRAGTLTIANRPSSGGGAVTYPVSIPDKVENGSVSSDAKNASKGSTVTITVKPEDGFKLANLTVIDKDGNKLEIADKGDGKYTFIMPAGKVEVKASFTKEVETSPFADVATDAYYYEAVKWAAENGITGGIGNGLFSPDSPCTRAQIVTFLWRTAGSPEPKTLNSFNDVVSGSYYEKAVAWAVENGITVGTSATTFSPEATCTRAHAVTFLAREAKATAFGSAGFRDVADNAYYAEAVKWATDNGITNGIGGGLFGSDNDCTRAQIVTFLWRLYAGK